MNKLSDYLLRAGLTKSIVIVTILSILLSILVTYCAITFMFGQQPDILQNLLVAVIVSGIVAPIASGGFLKLLFKVDALEKETRYLANFDALTGLYTRRAFYDHAQRQLNLARRESKSIAMLVADLDGFKNIKDTFGHQAGDMALKYVSHIIKQTVRESDIAGRVGGDEFVFCLPSASLEEALKFGQRLVENIQSSTFVYENNQIDLSMSIGLDSSDAHESSEIDLMIKNADQALYRAKKAGKNQLAV
jgi:diguanylate cyclase (GGDEF)-like protein